MSGTSISLRTAGDDPPSRLRIALIALAAAGGLAAIWLSVIGIRLVSNIDGPDCHEFVPFCTSPSQQSARHTLAEVCGVAVVAYLLAARPAFKSRRFGFASAVILVVIVLALAGLIADPVVHLDGSTGASQWFVESWP